MNYGKCYTEIRSPIWMALRVIAKAKQSTTRKKSFVENKEKNTEPR